MAPGKGEIRSVQTARHAWTYSDLVALPKDQLRHELMDGEHFVSPSPNTAHQSVSISFLRMLLRHQDARDFGRVFYAPFDVELSPFTVLVPDLACFTTERFARWVLRPLRGRVGARRRSAVPAPSAIAL
jgi:hypothetical protein